MRTEYLEYLLDLEKTKSLSKTAMNYYTSHQCINYAISSLEDEFAIKILSKNNRGIEFTEAGRAFLNFAKQILLVKKDFELEVLPFKIQKEERISGNLEVFLMPRVAYEFVIESILNFMNLNPDSNISISMPSAYSLFGPFKAIESGKDVILFSIDTVCVKWKDIKSKADEMNLKIELLKEQKVGIVVSNKSKYYTIVKTEKFKHIQEVNLKMPCVFFKYQVNEAAMEKDKKKNYCINDPKLLVKLILSGNYVGIVTDFEYNHLLSNNIECEFFPFHQAKNTVFYLLMYNSERKKDILLTKLIEQLKNALLD